MRVGWGVQGMRSIGPSAQVCPQACWGLRETCPWAQSSTYLPEPAGPARKTNLLQGPRGMQTAAAVAVRWPSICLPSSSPPILSTRLSQGLSPLL